MPARKDASRAMVRNVLAILNRFDPEGVSPGQLDGAPSDEYQNEALPIAGTLLRGDALTIESMNATWEKWFGHSLNNPELVAELNSLRAIDP